MNLGPGESLHHTVVALADQLFPRPGGPLPDGKRLREFPPCICADTKKKNMNP